MSKMVKMVKMVKTKIGKGDRVVIVRGEGRNAVDAHGQPAVCTVLRVDRRQGRAWLDVPKPKLRRGEREKPMRGAEQWKTVRYNPQNGEAGGLKIIKRGIHVSNLKVVERGARREFGNNG